MLQKTKLHEIFRLHATRFLDVLTKSIKKYDFQFFIMTQISIFSGISISAGEDGSIHRKLTLRSIPATMHGMPGCINAPMHGSTSHRVDATRRPSRSKLQCAHQRTRQCICHQKEKWCEALSLKSDRPYYVDFSVFDRSGKVSKSRNSEKFCKEL